MTIIADPICFDKNYCLSTDFSFSSDPYYTIPLSEKIDNFNMFIQNVNDGFQKYELRAIKDETFHLLLTRRDKVQKEETLFKIHETKTIYSGLLDPNIYSKHVGILKNYEILEVFKSLNEEIIINLLLLHNLYNLDKSPFKHWLGMIPLKHTSLISNINQNELRFLENDIIYNELNFVRGKMISDYELIKNLMQKNLTITQIKEFLGEKEEISFNDWVFCYNLVLSKSWDLKRKKYLIPGVDWMQYAPIHDREDFALGHEGFEKFHKKTYEGFLIYLSDRILNYKSEIIDNLGHLTNLVPLLFSSNIIKNNPTECIIIEVFNEKEKESLSLEQKRLLFLNGLQGNNMCVSNFEISFKRLIAVGEILNLGNNANTCLKSIDNKELEFFKIIDHITNKCKISKTWKNYQFLERIINKIDEFSIKNKENIDKINLSSYSSPNMKLILSYFEEKNIKMSQLMKEINLLLESKSETKKTEL